MTAASVRADLLAARRAKRQQYIDTAVARAKLLGRSLTCAAQPPEWHDACAGLNACMNSGLGCLCECHDGRRP